MRPLDVLETILRDLGMEAFHDLWTVQWEASQQTFPPMPLPVLDRSFVETQARTIGLDEDLCEALANGVTGLSRSPVLQRFLWHVYYRLFVCKIEAYPRWPDLPIGMDPAARLLYVYVFLAQTPKLIESHEEQGIERTISRSTLLDLQLWMRHYQRQNGAVGLAADQVSWLSLHFGGQLYQLGRLQFEFATFKYPFLAYQRRLDGRIEILSGPGNRFLSDGRFDGAPGEGPLGSWEAALERDDCAVAGYPISPFGRAVSTPATLPVKEWDLTLQPGDATLAVHIPATGPMDFEACGQSFLLARKFFTRHFPAYSAKAYTCSSWLLDPQLEAYTDPASNIVRFLREWHLLPYPNGTERETLRRVFGVTARPDDLNTLVQRTSLQRDTLAFLKRGGTPGPGIGVQFPRSMTWGKQVYRYRAEQALPD